MPEKIIFSPYVPLYWDWEDNWDESSKWRGLISKTVIVRIWWCVIRNPVTFYGSSLSVAVKAPPWCSDPLVNRQLVSVCVTIACAESPWHCRELRVLLKATNTSHRQRLLIFSLWSVANPWWLLQAYILNWRTVPKSYFLVMLGKG